MWGDTLIDPQLYLNEAQWLKSVQKNLKKGWVLWRSYGLKQNRVAPLAKVVRIGSIESQTLGRIHPAEKRTQQAN